MRLSNVTTGVIAAAVALTLGSIEVKAQDTTTTNRDTTTMTSRTRRARRTARSTTRIRVSKEQTSTGEVTPTPAPTPTVNQDSINAANAERARQDSIAAADRARQDSIANAERMRQDSIAAAERARQDSIARADSIAAAERAWRMRQIGGFYWGLAAGIAEPTQNVDIAHNTGFNAEMPFGIDPIGSPLGLRFDVGYTTFANRADYFGANTSGRPQVWSGSADLKLRLPVVQRFIHRASLYALGGATYYHYKNLTLVQQGGGTTVTSPDWSNKLGWNAGGGLSFGWGRTNLFVESRYMTFSNGGLKGGHVPIVLGFSWF